MQIVELAVLIKVARIISISASTYMHLKSM